MRLGKIDRQTVKALRDELDTILSEGIPYQDISVDVGNATFSPTGTNVTFKVELAILNADGSAQNRDADNWNRYAFRFGLPQNCVGKEVRIFGELYRMIGLKPKSRKYPVLAKRVSDKKTFKLPAGAVRNMLQDV